MLQAYSLAAGEVPLSLALSILLEIGTGSSDPPPADRLSIQAPVNPKDTLPVTIGVSLLLVPGKLIKRIEVGYFY